MFHSVAKNSVQLAAAQRYIMKPFRSESPKYNFVDNKRILKHQLMITSKFLRKKANPWLF